MLAISLVYLAGCAGPAKLARKSHEQLAEGEVKKAYETALKAVDKDPYNEAARVALGDAGAALVAYELQTLRSAVQVDTIQAAEVALRMAAIRNETALHGVSLPFDSLAAAEQDAARSGAARVYLRLGDEQLSLGNPKAAYGHFLTARRFEPDDADVAARLEQTYDAAVDRVLVAPISFETRIGVDREALSERLYHELASYTKSNLQFTELLGRGEEWVQMLSLAPGHLTRDRAIRIARDAGATRVVWTRIYGDRVASNSESFTGTLYHEVERKRADGNEVRVEEEVPFRAGIQDIWASVALECEVYDLADDHVVARRTGERGAGLRALRSSTGFPGDADDYELCTSSMESADKKRCRELREDWSHAMGDLSVKDFIERANHDPGTIVFGRGKHYGRASRDNRSYDIYYGSPPAETLLILNALSDAWREAASALQEADQN
jgi:tetratricopeptide (TPR) repeat protein